MEAHNIGEILEYLSLASKPDYQVFLRTPELKEFKKKFDLFPFPPGVCPLVQRVHPADYYPRFFECNVRML
jgi:hypothetical protein